MLNQHAKSLLVNYGWQRDETQPVHDWVLYVDLPGLGQVSFHSPIRMMGPDYDGEWDKQHQSEARVLAFCDQVMKGTEIDANLSQRTIEV